MISDKINLLKDIINNINLHSGLGEGFDKGYFSLDKENNISYNYGNDKSLDEKGIKYFLLSSLEERINYNDIKTTEYLSTENIKKILYK